MRATAALAVLACSTPSFAEVPPALAAQARAAVDADTPRLTAMFKDIHQNPELGFMETRTAAIVATELKALGFTVTTGIGGTGVVGVLRNDDGPVVMYRADMDANAVEEATGLPYASTVRVKRPDGAEVPVGHMCGHDAHVTCGRTSARIVAMRDVQASSPASLPAALQAPLPVSGPTTATRSASMKGVTITSAIADGIATKRLSGIEPAAPGPSAVPVPLSSARFGR